MHVSYLIAFVGGALTIFAPCAAMLLPSFFAYAFSSTRVMLARTGVFALGVILALLPFGAFAGTFGHFLRDNSATVSLIAGAVIIVLGFMQAFSLTFPVPQFASKLMSQTTSASTPVSKTTATETGVGDTADSANNKVPSAMGVFLLGLGYALAGVGCSGPILGAVLAYGSLGGSVIDGMLLMVFYGLGMATPVVLLALLWDSLKVNQKALLRPRPVQIFGRWTTVMNLISGHIFVVLGAILMFSGGQLDNFSLLTGEQQIELESTVAAALAAVPGWLFIALFAVILALLGLKFKSSK
ncbi:cytochrome c biogenesis CcdA family protein [Gleimia sp. 6138-11-ORH1]|uniref:cytochrome c biogenesis CcdA family protein n=1 Tax=Gleimia sp. 6138-11-ORH1 TaxID=2973937 RepID=UPI00216A7CCC|nr:cytochrome c biogenesis CcdA family protein [Gleimia sp. 6138-11-ORH1]MCS4485039.1 cytochrome c biogenesis CcdA family protein [Gleimia sp. 6138-11-ORH1]